MCTVWASGGGLVDWMPVCDLSMTSTAIDADVSRPVNTETCNGLRSICAIAPSTRWPLTTHNAMSSAARNCYFQLGMRCPNNWLMVSEASCSTCTIERASSPCHGDCRAGHQPLADGLTEIRDFGDVSSNVIIGLIFESWRRPKGVKRCF